MKAKAGSKTNNKTFDELMEKLTISEKQNDDLKLEIASLKRIQSEQSRALTKMVHENNYPQKIKGLIDELKYSKDKIKDLDEELKREARVCQSVQYNNAMLVDANRELKQRLMKRAPNRSGGSFSYVGEVNHETGTREVIKHMKPAS